MEVYKIKQLTQNTRIINMARELIEIMTLENEATVS